jgi:hypothetical protein
MIWLFLHYAVMVLHFSSLLVIMHYAEREFDRLTVLIPLIFLMDVSLKSA